MAVRQKLQTFAKPISGDPGKGGVKVRKYNLANTNIAMLGTDLEKEVRRNAANMEEQWHTAGKKVGLEIWRIEKFKVVDWPEDKYGRFYSGDSYIVLHTYKKGMSDALHWDIHFWIGNESSQDEYGTAAYKTVELDDYLGGAATQYREVEGKESRMFRKLFKEIIVMAGGVATGFNHVTAPEYRKRLLHVKGKMNVICREVPIHYNSMNSGDCFILDTGEYIAIWQGRECGPMERGKAANIAQALDDERGGAPVREVFEEDSGDQKNFWVHFPKGKGPVKSAKEGGPDLLPQTGDRVLLRLSDESGELKMQEIARDSNLRRDLIDSDDTYILDSGFEIYVWIGLQSSKMERKKAMDYAVEYIKRYERPLDTPIIKMLEGGENEMFESTFEQGVMSLSRPGDVNQDGSKTTFSAKLKQFQGITKAAAESTKATYKGTTGWDTITDLDEYYKE